MAIYAQPGVVNLADYATFLRAEPQIPPQAIQYPLSPPGAAALTATTGGSLSGAVAVVLTYVTQFGETLPSTSASLTLTSPDDAVSAASPATVSGATGYNVYAAASGALALQNSAPVAIGTAYTLTAIVAGASVPSADTSGSPWISASLARATALVQNFPGYVDQGDYVNVVYNLATHILVETAPDQGVTYFSTLRGTDEGGLKLSASPLGMLASGADQGTSSAFVVPEAMKRLSYQDLQLSKTSWGRVALGWGQDIGPVWGLT